VSATSRDCNPPSAIAFFAARAAVIWGTFLCGTFSAFSETPAPYDGQRPEAQQSTPEQQDDPNYNGEDFTRPQRSFETRFLYQTSSGATSQTDQGTWLLRANWKAELGNGWRLGLLGQVPVVDKATFNPSDANREFGVGDAAVQAALIHDIDRHWAFGFGARLVAPTGEDSLGSGKWQIMPGFGVRYSFLEIGPDTYFVPVVRYAISFAGDPSRRNISEPQIAPTFNIGLPDRWFVTLYPSNDIRINFGDPISGQTGRLFLPLDVALGRKMTDSLTISLEASVPIVNEYPVYNFKTELRIVKQF
jgi:hypothetical protein